MYVYFFAHTSETLIELMNIMFGNNFLTDKNITKPKTPLVSKKTNQIKVCTITPPPKKKKIH